MSFDSVQLIFALSHHLVIPKLSTMQLTFLLDQITATSSGLIQTNLNNIYIIMRLSFYDLDFDLQVCGDTTAHDMAGVKV